MQKSLEKHNRKSSLREIAKTRLNADVQRKLFSDSASSFFR